ncbi:hypothetical protein VTN77DRAFT_4404 [Rasamsonia byssochlamydoides]|uniref:uncharacterized protein n=1 Tax=Rasamsonia byssochlamydoides TaxID=89139 RepID=UPI003743EC4C
MWKYPSFPSLLSVESTFPFLLKDGRCLSCQFRGIGGATTFPRRYASNSNGVKKTSASSESSDKTPVQDQQKKPSGSPSDDEQFAPLMLDRPIGLIYPPEEGQNTGIDTRTLRQRRDDLVNYEKHLQRRKELTKQAAKPYFRDWTNLRYHEGKTFQSNPRLFKRDKALYFPNLYGITLASPREPQNTTTTLRGKVSVVSLFSSLWAEQQVATFTGPAQNPGLYDALRSDTSLAQKVDINLEENAMKAWLVRMFMWRMRRKLPAEQHKRYFLVRKGLTDGLKEAIGMMNSKVGYVYLLDDDCRIRWAGSGPAEQSEVEALNNGIRKLIEEKRKRLESELPVTQWESTKQKDEAASAKPRVVMMK